MTIRIFLILFVLISSIINYSQYDSSVVPINKSGFKNELPNDSLSLRWQKLLNFKCDEVLHNWWPKYKSESDEKGIIDFGYLENNSKIGEFGRETKGGIRPAAQAVYSIAVALFTNSFNTDYLSFDKLDALSLSVIIIKSLAKDHLVNGGINHPWGGQWQSLQWASKTAVAAWLLWDFLDSDTKTNIARMLAYEADKVLDKDPPSANTNYINDTKAEENGWDATGIQTACAMLPNHKNFKLWLEKSFEYRINALATPSDLENNKILQGRKVKEWISGYNADTLGAVGNHHAYPHPDYMAAPLRHAIEGSLFFMLGDRQIPVENSFNSDLIYKNFVDHVWNEESTIYKMNGSVYWPIDIENDRRFEFLTFGIIDLGAHIFGFDKSASVKGKYWEEKHTEKAIEMRLVGFASASAYLLRWLSFNLS